MGSSDWTALSDALDSATLLRGVTAGETPPSGGGTYVYGFRSTTTSSGAAGSYTNQTNYAPITTPASGGGGSVRGCIKRGTTTVSTGFAPLFFIGLQSSVSPSVLDEGYIIGLEDTSPHRVVVRKGRIVDGVPAADSENSLMRSVKTKNNDEWWHLRLDMVVNPSGDVVLSVFENDLDTYTCTSPTWVELDMEGNTGGADNEFIDDALGAASGSLPFVDGYVGFAMAVTGQGKRAYFDQIEIARQNP